MGILSPASEWDYLSHWKVEGAIKKDSWIAGQSSNVDAGKSPSTGGEGGWLAGSEDGRRNMNSDNGLVDDSGIYLMAFTGVHLLE
jgi:hypothetical protein